MGSSQQAHRRYMLRFLPITAAYVGGIALASALIPDHAPADARTIAISILPGLAVIGWLWAMGRLLVELEDEYLRMLEVRKFLVATGMMLAATSMWGILELYSPEVPRLPVFFVMPIWCAGLAVGALFNRLTFGGIGGDTDKTATSGTDRS
ncbi:hypothetical protein ACLIMP_03685 [Novosphingobium aerophilum]|uniref:hypothetical protein n=1 Tax=Novosphingobium TaxID=165696 RepID=UPI002D771C1D|nr:hypothetical protein [Novosphingobium sp. RL4]WRT93376.1 hypothetical protein U9J33_02365 [Novosphingobium sp. RL4]